MSGPTCPVRHIPSLRQTHDPRIAAYLFGIACAGLGLAIGAGVGYLTLLFRG